MYRGGLTDDPILAVAFVQRAAQVHDLCRQLIAFERRADLIRDTFDEGDFVFLKSLARLAPNESEQSKSLSADTNRRHERRASAEDRVERESPRKRQIGLEQAHRLALCQHLDHRWKGSHIERLSVFVE